MVRPRPLPACAKVDEDESDNVPGLEFRSTACSCAKALCAIQAGSVLPRPLPDGAIDEEDDSDTILDPLFTGTNIGGY